MVEDVRVAFDDRLHGRLGLLDDLAHHLLGAAGPATAPNSGDGSGELVSFSATTSTSLRSSSAAEPGGGPYWARRRTFSAARSSAHAVAQASASRTRTSRWRPCARRTRNRPAVGRGALFAHDGLLTTVRALPTVPERG